MPILIVCFSVSEGLSEKGHFSSVSFASMLLSGVFYKSCTHLGISALFPTVVMGFQKSLLDIRVICEEKVHCLNFYIVVLAKILDEA